MPALTHNRADLHTKRLSGRFLFLLVLLVLLALPGVQAFAAHPSAPGLVFGWELHAPKTDSFDAGKRYRLIISLTPDQPGAYFYAPFGEDGGQPAEEDAMSPVRLTLSTSDGQTVNATILYPPGVFKDDPGTGLKLPIYAGETKFIALIEPALVGKNIRLGVVTPICTGGLCSFFNREYMFQPTRNDVKTGENAVTPPGKYRDPSIKAEEAEPEAVISQGDPAGFADVLAKVEPEFFHAGLEVSSLARAVIFGLLAGLILNFMPCVLPVISLKLSMLVGLGGISSLEGCDSGAVAARRRVREYALYFSLGVLVWFGGLFSIIGGLEKMWGQFFQSQPLIVILAFILFLLGLSLFGVFSLPVVSLQVNSKRSLACQAFFGGLLATLLATPCSGPLLGGVLGWAVNQPLHYLGITLLSVALGMCAPFILIALRPRLAAALPKPGSWSVFLEKIMGFMLMGTVIYLVSLLDDQLTVPVTFSLFLLAFGTWLWSNGLGTGRISLLRKALTICLIVYAVYLPFKNREESIRWENFSEREFVQKLGKENLFLDFTADWCINCKALEYATLTPDRLAEWQSRYGLTYIKVDLTKENPAGQALLAKLGSASIPLLAIFPSGNTHTRPMVLRDLVGPGQVEEALQQTLD